MKQIKIILIVLVCLFISMNLGAQTTASTPKKLTKKEMMSELKKIYDQSLYHNYVIRKIGRQAFKTKANYSNFIEYAKIATKSRRTKLLIKIAKKTSRLKRETLLPVEAAKLVDDTYVTTKEVKRAIRKSHRAKSNKQKKKFDEYIASLGKW
ncbi:hypothetical protein [Marinifilum sp. D737]|uniref:hypothetical protein n=1 Tax=Marinifilum sp. D737 TaxID=2969628 RepID=UPI002275D279|nr:hypothetical protein [Marinifilum sp. D737]MCY1633236.1 hypothetical protein [Marinifilum sp. D737]